VADWTWRTSFRQPVDDVRLFAAYPQTMNVYARFWRQGEVWRVSLSDMSGNSRMRDYTFAGPGKIESMAKRGGALKDLAAHQALQTGIRNGAGGFQMVLTEEQFGRVTLGRK
jgi:hypothetical protein